MMYRLYKVTAPDGRAYIGCTKLTLEQRWVSHRGYRASNGVLRALHHAIYHYGRDAFVMEHLASAVGPHNAVNAEAQLIAQYRTLAPHGYNLQPAGPIRGARGALAAA